MAATLVGRGIKVNFEIVLLRKTINVSDDEYSE